MEYGNTELSTVESNIWLKATECIKKQLCAQVMRNNHITTAQYNVRQQHQLFYQSHTSVLEYTIWLITPITNIV